MKRLYNIIRVVCNWSFFRWDHLAVCAILGLFGWLLILITSKVGIFDPVAAAFSDFSMTDVFFEIQSNGHKVQDNDIVIVDMTELKTRDEIAQAITDIKSCHPKVLGIDLIFERPSFDQLDDVALISAIESGNCPQIWSCKLRDYDQENGAFKDCLFSFFHDVNNYEWGYTNYYQKRMGGVTRKTSQTQLLNDSIVYSFPYLLACSYTDKQPVLEKVNERDIIFANVKFNTLKSTEVVQHKELLKDRLVLLGTMNEEADMHFSPLGKIPGVQVIAYSILSYMKHGEITRMSRWASLILTFVLCYIAAWVGYKIQRRNFVLGSLLMKFFIFGLCVVLIGYALYVFITRDYYIDLLYPLLGLALEETARGLYAGTVKWAVKKKKIGFLKSSIYAKV
ncbi:MAG: CHASE2 domain-containing protein [Prevotella sp.]|nr:CHASE2 domain-containing protein [Prevotella sp.]